MAREDLHFRLRIPEELKIAIEAAAEKNRRSMTAEIVERLANSLNGEFVASGDIKAMESKSEELEAVVKAFTDELNLLRDRERNILDKWEAAIAAVGKQNETIRYLLEEQRKNRED